MAVACRRCSGGGGGGGSSGGGGPTVITKNGCFRYKITLRVHLFQPKIATICVFTLTNTIFFSRCGVEDLCNNVHAFGDSTKRTKTLVVQIGVVFEIDEDLRGSCIWLVFFCKAYGATYIGFEDRVIRYDLFPFSIFAGDTRNAKLNNEPWNDPKKSTLLEEIVLKKRVKTINALR